MRPVTDSLHAAAFENMRRSENAGGIEVEYAKFYPAFPI